MLEKKKIVVLGAGVTGLAAAYKLSLQKNYEVHVIEKSPVIGGLCSSFKEGDFILDYGPHKFYTLIDGIVEELEDIMDGELLIRDKAQSLFMNGKFFTFPLKLTEMLTRFPLHKSVFILMSFFVQTVKSFITRKPSRTYEEFITERFGRGLYASIFEPLAKKIYGNPSDLDRKLAEVRISSPGLVSVIKQLLFSKKDRTLSAPKFHYPRFGYGRIPEKLKEKAEKNGAQFHLSATVTAIHKSGDKINAVTIKAEGVGTMTIPCEALIYTIPISQIGKLLVDAPESLQNTCSQVKSRNTIIYYFLLKSKPVLPSMWVFYPEQKFRFGRLSEMNKFSPDTVPAGHTALMVDFTCEPSDPAWKMNDQELGEMLLKELDSLKLFKREQIVKQFSKRFESFYPVYHVGFQKQLDSIRDLETQFPNLYFIGRHGDFNYNNADQCLDMGFQAAQQIVDGGSIEDWRLVRSERFDRYKIVD